MPFCIPPRVRAQSVANGWDARAQAPADGRGVPAQNLSGGVPQCPSGCENALGLRRSQVPVLECRVRGETRCTMMYARYAA